MVRILIRSTDKKFHPNWVFCERNFLSKSSDELTNLISGWVIQQQQQLNLYEIIATTDNRPKIHREQATTTSYSLRNLKQQQFTPPKIWSNNNNSPKTIATATCSLRKLLQLLFFLKYKAIGLTSYSALNIKHQQQFTTSALRKVKRQHWKY